MTDTATVVDMTEKSGWGKAISAWATLESSNYIAPAIVTYLHTHFPDITDGQILDILSFIQASLIAGIVWLTPHNLVTNMKACIIWLRRACATLRGAFGGDVQPLD